MRVLSTLAVLLLTALFVRAQEPATLEQKVARMLIVGFRGTEITDNMPVVTDIRDRGVGGIILFEHNVTPVEKRLNSVERLKNMCAKIHALAPHPIIVSIDQEGGKVNRLKSKYGFVPSVTQEYIGGVDNKDTTRYYAEVMARQLRDLGFNVNFTPCVDVNVNPQCPAIGKFGRSFSSSPYKVVEHGAVVMDVHHQYGVKTAIKHFPGHGSSSADSHLGLTDVTDTWSEEELIPFRELLNDPTQNMVMISHVFNRDLDETYPATLSHKIVTGILRERLGWDGVAITDDMHMKAISDHYSLKESLTLTINAGVDMIILSSNIPGNTAPVSAQAIDAIVSQVKSGAISEARIDEAYQRICRLFNEQTGNDDEE